MTVLTNLDELDPATKVIYDTLEPDSFPPFDGDIVFSAGGNHPKRNIALCDLIDLGVPRFLQIRNMDIAAKFGGPDGKAETLIEEVDVPVQTVVRGVVGPIDERIGALDQSNVLRLLIQSRDQGIVFPNLRTERSNVGPELTGITSMKIPYSRRQHNDIARRVKTLENESLH